MYTFRNNNNNNHYCCFKFIISVLLKHKKNIVFDTLNKQ